MNNYRPIIRFFSITLLLLFTGSLNAQDGPMPPLDISEHYGLDWEF